MSPAGAAARRAPADLRGLKAEAGGRLATVARVARERWRTVLLSALAVLVLTTLVQLVALVVRFGNLPNYATLYDFPGNVWRIVRSTPAISDMPPIIADEWLVEIGYMNYDYGLGISEWALTLVPAKMVVVLFTGALVGLLIALLSARRACSRTARVTASAAGGAGASLIAFTSLTMSWVVCCATPNWVVGLAMMGLGTATSLWLEPIGGWVTLAGFAFLAVAIARAAAPAGDPSAAPAARRRAEP